MSYTIRYEEGGIIDAEVDTLEQAELIAQANLEGARRMNTTIMVVEEDDGIGWDDMWNPGDDYSDHEYQGV